MNPRTIKTLSFALIGLLLFLAILVFSRLYNGNEVPTQFAGALLGAIVTAAITMALLHGQSQAEETKERNVRVFEEKSRRYNEFLEKLWKVWEDRHVTLEELNDLIQIVSKDIIIYTKVENTQKLLRSLTAISEYANKRNISSNEQKQVQAEVFKIINTLSEEMNLGGRINREIEEDLIKLEDKVLPFLLAKQCRKELLDGVGEVLKYADESVKIAPPYFGDWAGDEYLWCKVEGGPVELAIGPVSNRTNKQECCIGFFFEHRWNPEFRKYRQSSDMFGKNFLGHMLWDTPSDKKIQNALPDFSKTESVAEWARRLSDDSLECSPGTMIGKMILKYVRDWKMDGRNVKCIIDDCCGNTDQSVISNRTA